ncbi:MAG: 50S ribosomal protein L23 [Rickettsiales bacterium]|nr:50S ribosomal protein L23 [Rickettsiales bacterium]|tara:strand:+ start:1249 stop:1554 length:306 start_codon:yes stop_codon:yes gene_type:complete
MSNISEGKKFEIVRSPLVSEKSTFVSQFNHYVFKVSISSTKSEIKTAVEKLFNVKVLSVNTLVQKGKIKRFRGKIGRRIDIKKAYVKLDKNNTIDYTGGVK